jgi:hypothetical protein
MATTAGISVKSATTTLDAIAGRTAISPKTIAKVMSIVESISQRPFNALPKKGAKSDAATAATAFLNASVCTAPPRRRRAAEAPRNIRERELAIVW